MIVSQTTASSAWRAICLIGLCGLVAGCSGGKDPFSRKAVSGQVTFQGKPVPAGSIWFEPTAALGNQAPTGMAVIRNGEFTTAPKDSPVAGQYTIRITGYASNPDQLGADEDAPETLFKDYTQQVELPPADGTLRIDIPET